MIEIQQPELEALIRKRMAAGEFRTVEEMLLQALSTNPNTDTGLTGSALVEVMQNSPHKEIDLVQPPLYFSLSETDL